MVATVGCVMARRSSRKGGRSVDSARLRAENRRLRAENARLRAERAASARQAARAEALREVGRQLSAEIDLDRLLDTAATQLTALMDVRDCVLLQWDEADASLTPILYVCDGDRRPWEARIRPGEGRGLTSAVVAERRAIHADDYLEECLRRGLEPVALDGDWRGLAWIGAPLLTGGRLVGVVVVERRGRPFGADDAAILETLAGQIAAALENARLYAEVRQLAASDPLTGLAHHRQIHDRLDQELARAARFDRPLAVAMLDLDDFKRYNDAYGHQVGDDLLRAVAQALRDEARATDILGRYGGDEFLLVLPETTRQGAEALLARIRRRLAAWRPADNLLDGPMRASAGVAVFPDDATDARALVAIADAGLYAEKRGRRVRRLKVVMRDA
jgi:diguanylate cyclase (GGDEF)-like protein